MRKAIGIILILLAIVVFAINFGLYHFWIFDSLSSIIDMFPSWIFNPLSLLTANVVGNIWLIGGSVADILNAVWAVIYSAILAVLGVVLAK